MKILPTCHFTRELRRLNGYTENMLREWWFEPGMKFGDSSKWWKPGTTRKRPHEGLDLLIFRSARGERHILPPGTTIPPLLDGIEVARIADLLGETVILAHDFQDEAGRRLHTFYAHLLHTGAPASGKTKDADQQLGKIAVPAKMTIACPPHLHISLAWVNDTYPIQDFHWGEFRASGSFIPGDPLALLEGEKDTLYSRPAKGVY